MVLLERGSEEVFRNNSNSATERSEDHVKSQSDFTLLDFTLLLDLYFVALLIDILNTAVRISLLFITNTQLFHQQQQMVWQASVYVYIKIKNGAFCEYLKITFYYYS